MIQLSLIYKRVFILIVVFCITHAGIGAGQVDENEPLVIDGSDGAENTEVLIATDEVSEAEKVFIRANELYRDAKYEEAIMIYEQIMESGYHSADLYFNLGNAYYRSNKVPRAILNYERAALLSPGDDDIQFNIELSRMHVRDRIEKLPEFFLNRWWKGLRDSLSIGAWATLSIGTFIISLVLVSIFLMSSSAGIKRLFFWLAVIFMFTSLFSFSLGLDQRNHIRNHNSAIVFSPVVSVKSSPDLNSTDLFIIHEGTKVWVEDSIGEWRSVRLSDGNMGWLSRDAIEMI